MFIIVVNKQSNICLMIIRETRWLRMQIQPRKSFHSFPFHKNLANVILVWGDNQHLKMHTKCSFQEPVKLVIGIRLYSSNLCQLNKNLPPMCTTKLLRQWIEYRLEFVALRRNIFFAYVPLVCDNGSVILARKVIPQSPTNTI